MRIRKLLVVAAASIAFLATGLMGVARAAETAPPPEAEFVGGGATGFDNYVARLNQYGELVADHDSTAPSVTLPDTGGNLTKGLVNLNQSGISVGVLRVHTEGTLAGTPYASSYAELARVSIPGVDIAALRTSCIWDGSGSKATTQIVTLAGITYTPAPGTTIHLPLLGDLILNQQGIDYAPDVNGNYHATAWVVGAQLLKSVTDRNGNTTLTDHAFGISSCDPFVLPNLGSLLKLGNSGG